MYAGRSDVFLELSGRGAWRSWLQANSSSSRGIWLVFRKMAAGGPGLSYGEALDEALCFGWIDGLIKRLDEDRYARRFMPRRPGSSWSEVNKARAGKLVEAGAMTAAGKAAIDEAVASGEWALVRRRPDVPTAEMPSELTDALASSSAASEFFDSLPASCRRSYVLWIASAKKPGTRKRRAQEAAGMLARRERLGLR